MSKKQTFIIVGASLAGAKAAEELRERGFDGRVVLIGSEPERPYERPPLTKDYLRGESDRESTFVHEDGFYAQHEISLMTGRPSRRSTPPRRRHAGGRRELGYDRLLLATGAEPRQIRPRAGARRNSTYPRTLADCDLLQDRLDRSARRRGRGSRLDRQRVRRFSSPGRPRGHPDRSRPLCPTSGSSVPRSAAFYRDVHAEHGVDWRWARGSSHSRETASLERLRTSSGRVIDCDLAVVGIGVIPRLELAKDAGLPIDNGIVVDERCAPRPRTSSPPATWPTPATPSTASASGSSTGPTPSTRARRRPEHARPAPAYDRLPYFFSDQYDLGMEYSGLRAAAGTRSSSAASRASGEFIAFWLRDGRSWPG